MSRINGPVWKTSRRLGFSILETGEEIRNVRMHQVSTDLRNV